MASSHSATQHQLPALGPHLVGAWSDSIVDPKSWGFSSAPAHDYVVRASASRLRALRRILAAKPDAVSPIKPTSGRPHMATCTAASGGSRRAGQPDRQPKASLHSLIGHSSQGPHESEGPQTPPQMLPGCISPGRGRHRSGIGHPSSLQRYRLLLKSRLRSSLHHLHSGSS